ncbi:MAG: hypothetical protein WC561_00580 [Candidatus Omnitrophota bacterium]
MSSKNRKKSPFSAPSRTPEKYLDSFDRAKSGETSALVDGEENQERITSTDTPLGNVIIPPSDIKAWEMPRWLKHFLIWGPLLAAVLWFCWSLNASVTDVKSKTMILENKMDSTSKELITGQNDIKLTLQSIIGNIDRLLDRVLFLQKSK